MAPKSDSLTDPPPFLGVRNSLKNRSWVHRLDPAHEAIATAISQRYGLGDAVARLLAGRAVSMNDVEAYLDPSLKSDLPDPSTLTDMDSAAERISDAIAGNEAIAIFGDYDVDGATSSALLHQLLSEHGLSSKIYIPDRVTEGYGPTPAAIDELIDGGATLIIAVDCGTTSFEALQRAADRKTDVVVIDHHQVGLDLPPAVAIVNPNRQDDQSGQGHLAAVGVCFLVAVAVVRALRERGFYASRRPPDLLKLLDLVALGTVCDIVPLIGVNRAFVVKGLTAMRRAPRPGLQALAKKAGLNGPINSGHLGFMIGPRINAGGRIGDAALGSKLLVEPDAERVEILAEKLDHLNRERQAVESDAVDRAIGDVLALESTAGMPPVLVVSNETWHPGIVGLVAARVKERFGHPAFALAIDEVSGLATGSGRSIPGVDLGAVVRNAVARGFAKKGGGHQMAAGLTVDASEIAELSRYLCEELGQSVKDKANKNALVIDGAMTSGGATVDLIETMERAGPFGSGNPAPVFAFPAHRITYAEKVGTSHVRLGLSAGTGSSLKAIAFRALDSDFGLDLLAAKGKTLHVAGTLDVDHWGGSPKPQLRVLDAAIPSDHL